MSTVDTVIEKCAFDYTLSVSHNLPAIKFKTIKFVSDSPRYIFAYLNLKNINFKATVSPRVILNSPSTE